VHCKNIHTRLRRESFLGREADPLTIRRNLEFLRGFTMLLNTEWAGRFIQACAKVPSTRRQSLAAAQVVYSTMPEAQCWVVTAGYVKLLDPRVDGNHFVRLIQGRGGLFGDRPFGTRAFRGYASPQHERAVAHGPAEVLELDLAALESAAHIGTELASLLLESVSTRAQFLERRLLWQFTTPIRARVAAALRDLICFEGQRCRHGHTIDVRLSHQDLAELVGAARPVVSAELVQMRHEGLVEYTRCYFCVDDLAGLNRVAGDQGDFAAADGPGVNEKSGRFRTNSR
jgi:CRP/FNR family cyclic AMP-dependent transcriptional regulator